MSMWGRFVDELRHPARGRTTVSMVAQYGLPPHVRYAAELAGVTDEQWYQAPDEHLWQYVNRVRAEAIGVQDQGVVVQLTKRQPGHSHSMAA